MEMWIYTEIQHRETITDISRRFTEVFWFERCISVGLFKQWLMGHLHHNYLDDSHTYWPPPGLGTHYLLEAGAQESTFHYKQTGFVLYFYKV